MYALALLVLLAQRPMPQVRHLDFAGTHVAAALGGRLALWDARTGERVHERDFDAPVTAVAFAPKGAMLAVAVGERVHIFDTKGTPLKVLELPKVVLALAFGPDGKLATSSADGQVRVWDAASGRQLAQTKPERYPMKHLTFAPDGKRLAGGNDDDCWLWDAATGNEVRKLPKLVSTTTGLAFSADGATLLRFLAHDASLLVVDAEGRVRTRYDRLWGTPAVRQVGGTLRIVTTGYTGPEQRLDTLSLRLDGPTAEERQRLDRLIAQLDEDALPRREAAVRDLIALGTVAEPVLARTMKESPSAEVRLRARLARTALQEQHESLVPPGPGVASLALAPDGKRLAVGGTDGVVRVVDGDKVVELRFGRK